MCQKDMICSEYEGMGRKPPGVQELRRIGKLPSWMKCEYDERGIIVNAHFSCEVRRRFEGSHGFGF
jgi:hypothetical protein